MTKRRGTNSYSSDEEEDLPTQEHAQNPHQEPDSDEDETSFIHFNPSEKENYNCTIWKENRHRMAPRGKKGAKKATQAATRQSQRVNKHLQRTKNPKQRLLLMPL